MASQFVIAPERANNPVFKRDSFQGSETKKLTPIKAAATMLVPKRLSKKIPAVPEPEMDRL
jgi:hypothetical protein